jgi:hypothetical protein
VGVVFPVDLFVGAGADGVPVARADQGAIGIDLRPSPGVRLGARAFERDLDGLLLVAPSDGEPFTVSAFATGSGRARGVAAGAEIGEARYNATASYAFQEVRFEGGESSYAPAFAAKHLLEGGVTVFPAATASVRLGATVALGRRTTTIPGGFEWESCNLVDQGCEFGGSPHYGGEPLGGVKLPAYIRVDLGLRKHWHVGLGGRDGTIALFATVTNLLARNNVLTYARDEETGAVAEIEMRPLAPLVVGVDWQL